MYLQGNPLARTEQEFVFVFRAVFSVELKKFNQKIFLKK